MSEGDKIAARRGRPPAEKQDETPLPVIADVEAEKITATVEQGEEPSPVAIKKDLHPDCLVCSYGTGSDKCKRCLVNDKRR